MNARRRSALRFAIAAALLVGAYEMAMANELPPPLGSPEAPIPPAHNTAPANCGPEEAFLAALSKKYNEAVVWRGDGDDGLSMILTESPEGKTWTLLSAIDTPKGGVACVVNSGSSSNHGKDGLVV